MNERQYRGNLVDPYRENPAALGDDPSFDNIEHTIDRERALQSRRWNYTYVVSGSVVGGQTIAYDMNIEQGTDFKGKVMMGRAYSYTDAATTSFPWPGATDFAMSGLMVNITDSNAGRSLTSGFVPFECMMSPGYGIGLYQPLQWPYFLYRNSKLRFDIRNTDNSTRTHSFSILLNGFKLSPAN